MMHSAAEHSTAQHEGQIIQPQCLELLASAQHQPPITSLHKPPTIQMMQPLPESSPSESAPPPPSAAAAVLAGDAWFGACLAGEPLAPAAAAAGGAASLLPDSAGHGRTTPEVSTCSPGAAASTQHLLHAAASLSSLLAGLDTGAHLVSHLERRPPQPPAAAGLQPVGLCSPPCCCLAAHNHHRCHRH